MSQAHGNLRDAVGGMSYAINLKAWRFADCLQQTDAEK